MKPQRILAKSKNWKSFKSHLKALRNKDKGDAFELLTKCYLLLHPAYTTQLKHVWLLIEVPTKVRKKLNLPDTDEGIDLIAETKEGTYWAIQCKYREDEKDSLSRPELSTFTDLTFGICKNIELGLVCTSTDRTSHKLKMYGDRLSFCSGEVWRSLDEEFFKRLHKHLKKKAAPLTPLKPRPHQKRAITKAHRHFVEEKNSRGKLIMPCGTGKSLAGYWIAEKFDAKKILVTVPSLALIRQTLEVWARESVAHKQKVNWIAVCSDESVGDIEKDDIAVFSQDLGIKIHTDPKEISQWLKKKHAGKTIVFSTYQSGKALFQAAKKSKTTFDLAIMDEAHKTVGKKNSLFSHLLHDKNIKIKKRIFMTATERRYRGQSEQMLSMEDLDVYGETFEMLSFKEALETKPPILSDYKIVTIFVSKDEVKELIKKNIFVKPDKGKWDKEVEAEMLASIVSLRKAMKKHPIKKAVSFHNSIIRAKVFKDSQDVFTKNFPRYGKLETFHVTGKLPTSIRARELEEFSKSTRSLITNARCLTEGVDVPNIDCVLFADPKRSTIDIVQAVGRALRPHKDKKYGYVIIPVLIDKEIREGGDINKEAYDSILTTLRALAADDERIVEYFKSVSQGRRRGRGNGPIEIDLPEGIKIDAEEFCKSVELKFWSRLAKLSWRPFEEAREFVHTLNLKSGDAWNNYCKGRYPNKPKRPEDIPIDPTQLYKDKGWISFGDWLGSGYVATQLRDYRTFDQARKFVHALKLKSNTEWRNYCKNKYPNKPKKPEDIPANPERVYENKGWSSYGDWLGTGFISTHERQHRPFRQARMFARSLNLKSRTEWVSYCKGKFPNKPKKPEDIPLKPERVYKSKGWISNGDWLGTGVVASQLRQYRSFKEARKFVHTLKLKSSQDWNKYYKGSFHNKPKMPQDIPTNPNKVYRDEGWIHMGDWLGTNFIPRRLRKYKLFNRARKFVHSLKLKSANEWRDYCKGKTLNKPKLPEDIPVAPNQLYLDKGWISWGDWLGTNIIAYKLKKYRPFEEARKFAHTLNLKSRAEWNNYCKGKYSNKPKRPEDIPITPDKTYKNEGWIGVGDWLGTGFVSHQLREYRPFNQARKFARSLNLKSGNEWKAYCGGKYTRKRKKPDDIPANPNQTYKDKGWISSGDWLGTGYVASQLRQYRSFDQARKFVHALKLKDPSEWKKYCKGEISNKPKKPEDIPAYPSQTYNGKGWINFRDWIGESYIHPLLKKDRPFKQARKFAQSLKLTSNKEWRNYCGGKYSSKKPEDIPSAPNSSKAYEKSWISWPDWLGTVNKKKSK